MCVASTTIKMSGPALNSGASGLLLAEDVLGVVQSGGVVRLDFVEVERMTASYANALVMTLLDSLGTDVLSKKVVVASAADTVSGEWTKAIKRFARGIRLSSQRPGAA